MSDDGFIQGYSPSDVEVPLPDGSTATCKVLTVERVAYYLELYFKATEGNGKAMLAIVKEFPKEVGIGDKALTMGEVFDVLRSFFRAKRPKRPTTADSEKTTSTSVTPGQPVGPLD